MKRFINVHTGEIMTGCSQTVLTSDAERACLVIVAHDSTHKVGALAHATFKKKTNGCRKTNGIKEAPEAIDELIKEMKMLGSDEENIDVCLIAGENVPHKEEDPLYNQNIESAKDIFRRYNVRIKETLKSEIGNSHVSLDVATGQVSCW